MDEADLNAGFVGLLKGGGGGRADWQSLLRTQRILSWKACWGLR